MRIPSTISRRSGGASLLALSLSVLFAAAACAPKDKTNTDDEDLALDGVESVVSESDTEALGAALLSAASGSLSLASDDLTPAGTLETKDLGDATKFFFFPRGCLTTAHDAQAKAVTYEFTKCAGPRGLLRVTGKLIVTYTVPEAGKLSLDFAGSNLLINRATASWTAHADIQSSGATRTMQWSASLRGTLRNKDFERKVTRKLVWTIGDGCIALDGTSEGRLGARTLRIDVANVKRCRRECPEAGGKITISGTSGAYSVSFDGSNQAALQTPSGAERSVSLSCGS